jgi:hypothetical protein
VERARARISGNVRPAVSGLRVWELSGGLLYCGHCGSRMRGQNHTKRGKTLFYYEYARKINESYGACEQRAHRAEALEEYVMEAVSALLSNPMERWLEDLSAKRSRYVDLYADGVIASKAELGEKLAALYDEAEALAAALDRSDNIEKWQEQKRGVLFIYRAFAAQAPSVFTSEHRRAMYERIGLRVTAYKSSPPEIQITLDPNALP